MKISRAFPYFFLHLYIPSLPKSIEFLLISNMQQIRDIAMVCKKIGLKEQSNDFA